MIFGVDHLHELNYAKIKPLGSHLFQPFFKAFQIHVYNYLRMNYPYNQYIIFIILCKLHVSQVSDLRPTIVKVKISVSESRLKPRFNAPAHRSTIP